MKMQVPVSVVQDDVPNGSNMYVDRAGRISPETNMKNRKNIGFNVFDTVTGHIAWVGQLHPFWTFRLISVRPITSDLRLL
jgi:hypothetical protein